MIRYASLSIVLLALMFSGCASIPTSLATIEKPETAQKLVKTKSLIFGSLTARPSSYYIKLIARNQQTNRLYAISSPSPFNIFSKFKEDNSRGYYFSFLPAGQYVVERVNFTDMMYDGSVPTNMSFSVPEHSVVYLGALQFQWETTKNYLFAMGGNITFSVEDHSDDAYDRLWKRFPDLRESDLEKRISLIRVKGSRVVEPAIAPDSEKVNPEDKKVEYLPLTSENINKTK